MYIIIYIHIHIYTYTYTYIYITYIYIYTYFYLFINVLIYVINCLFVFRYVHMSCETNPFLEYYWDIGEAGIFQEFKRQRKDNLVSTQLAPAQLYTPQVSGACSPKSHTALTRIEENARTNMVLTS